MVALEQSPDVTFVDDAAVLGEHLRAVDRPVVGIDVERDDSLRYFRAPALIQIGVEGHCVLVDAVTLTQLPELDAFLASRLVVLHSLENDLTPLAAAAVRPQTVCDTAVAASLLGLPIGLAPLLREVLEVTFPHDKERLQRADWSARPLPADMAAYAAADVVHLPWLWEVLETRLREAGRHEWYEQELAFHIERALDDDRRAWTRTKGAGRLDAQQRAVLRELWTERESIAREHDIAPQRLLRDEMLVNLAANPPKTVADIAARGARRPAVRDYGDRFVAAAARGVEGPPERSTSGLRRSTDADRKVYDALRKRRAEVARELGIEAGVVCPGRPLWGVVLADPASAEELCALADLRPWQSDVLAEPLWEAYETSRAATTSDE